MIAGRDRAILRVFLYTGARIGSVCRLRLEDFVADGEEYTLRLSEKGGQRRTIGIHYLAGQAIAEYIETAKLIEGPLFRPRAGGNSKMLVDRGMNETSMWRLVRGYLNQLPGGKDLTPHSLRATTATLLLDAGLDITHVQHLLGHRYVTTTQIYDKRRRLTRDSASHHVPL